MEIITGKLSTIFLFDYVCRYGYVIYMCRWNIKHRACSSRCVVYLKFHPTSHAWVGWVSEIKYELMAAARGALKAHIHPKCIALHARRI